MDLDNAIAVGEAISLNSGIKVQLQADCDTIGFQYRYEEPQRRLMLPREAGTCPGGSRTVVEGSTRHS